MEYKYNPQFFSFNISQSELDDLKDDIEEFFDLQCDYQELCDSYEDVPEEEYNKIKEKFDAVVDSIKDISSRIN